MNKAIDLQRKLADARFELKIGDVFRHYKGGVYEIKGHTINTTTGEVDIRYRRIDGPDFDAFYEADIEFNRPFSEWYDIVDYEVSTGHITRFVSVRKVTRWE